MKLLPLFVCFSNSLYFQFHLCSNRISHDTLPITIFQVLPVKIGLELDDDEAMSGDDDPTSSSSSSIPAPSQNALQNMDFGAAHAVVPLPTCPHLEQVAALPPNGIDSSAVCSDCQIGAEVWTCLTCYQVGSYQLITDDCFFFFSTTAADLSTSMP